MLKTWVIEIFLMELLLIQNTHPHRLHVLYFIKRFLPMKPTRFINSPLESINFALSSMWTCHNDFKKSLFLVRSQIGSRGVFDSILMHCNSNGWFLVRHIVSSYVFLIMYSNLFCSPLWKVTTSFGSIFGYSNCFRLPMWPTSTLSCKTCSILFFILLVNTIGIL